MLTRIPRHLRGNAVAYLALFVALSGTSAAAVTLQDNSVLSKHIKNGAVKKADIHTGAVDSSRVKDGSLAPADRVPGFGAAFAQAGHTHDARYVNEGQLDAVGGGMIADTERSVPVPLGSFNDCQGSGDEIDFTSPGDDRADFVIDGAGRLRMRFDDDAGNDDRGTPVCSSITVPPDYVSAVGLRVVVSKDGDSGNTEYLGGYVGSAFTLDETSGVAPTSMLLDAPTLNPGAALTVSLVVGTSVSTMDDTVDIHSVDFVYKSRQ